MKKVHAKAFGGAVFLLIAVAAVIFFSAWTFEYWQGWAFLVAFFVPAFLITFYLMKKDPKLLERRISAGPLHEKETSQKIIQSIAQLTFIAMIAVPVLDHRFGWSAVPALANVVGDVFVVVGFYIVFLVFKENTYASALVEVDTDQKVVSTGPYAIVRHPMYSGALILLLGAPVALGSWWGLLTIIPFTMVIVARLLDEEKLLERDLPGYSEYTKRVTARLIPFIW